MSIRYRTTRMGAAGVALSAAVTLAGCGSSGGGGGPDASARDGESPEGTPGDGPTSDDGAQATEGGSGDGGLSDGPGSGDGGVPDATTTSDAGDGGSMGYSLFVTESPPGPTIAQNLWEGVLRFTVAGSGAPPAAVAGIDQSLVSDPIGLAFRATSSEIFVGNRFGNIAPGGVAGSISRFKYDPVSGTTTPNGMITGNGLNEVGQLVFQPTTGELLAANFAQTNGVTPTGGPAISRFTFDNSGNAVANGTLGNAPTQGLAMAPDGNSIYATSGGVTDSTIRQYDLTSGMVTVAATVPSVPRLFYMAVRNGELYVAAVDVNSVYRFTIGVGGALTAKDSFAATGAIAIAFSPDATELFTSGHLTTNVIDRFAYAAGTDEWTPVEVITTPSSLGGIMAVPGATGTPVDGGIVVTDASAD